MTPSYNNLMLVIKKETVENRRKSLLALGGWTALCFLAGGWIGYFGGNGGESLFVIYLILWGVMTGVVASLSFSDMKTREGRISLLMTPATAADKTIVRGAGVLIVSVILCFCGYFGLETGRWLVDGIANSDWSTYFLPTLDPLGNGWATALVIGSWLMSVGCYFLGSVLWPKYSFLKSLLAIWVVQMALGLAGAFVVKVVVPHLAGSFFDSDCLVYAIVICTYIVAAGLFVLAWLRLKRSTIVNRLF